MTIIQINEQGAIAVPEQKQEVQNLFKSMAGKECEISLKEVNEFTTLLQESITLQNQFSEMVNENDKTWTNENFAVLRGKMSSCYYRLIDDFAKAKSDEKTADLEMKLELEAQKTKFLDLDQTPSSAATRAKSTATYREKANFWLESYKVRCLLELHLESLDKAMNAIAGLSKHDVNKLKF